MDFIFTQADHKTDPKCLYSCFLWCVVAFEEFPNSFNFTCLVGTFLDAELLATRILRNLDDLPGGPVQILLMTIPLLVTNIVATSLIGYQAW